MFHRLGLITLLALSLLAFGCGKSANPKTQKVAFIARAQGDSFAAWLASAVKEEAAKYPNIDLHVFDGKADDATENNLIETAIVNNYKVIIIQPNNGSAQKPYAEKAVKAGIITLTTNARIKGITGASSVDADPYEQAAVNARLALTQIPQNARVVVLNGPSGNFHATARRESWHKEFFAKRTDVKIVGEQIANWNKADGMKYMETWIQKEPQIDAIISMNDNMCAGALEATKNDPRFKNLLAYGVDGTAEACQLIQSGRMTATSLQSAYDLSAKILDTTNKLLTGTPGPIDTDIDCPLITKANVQQYLDMHKKAGAIK